MRAALAAEFRTFDGTGNNLDNPSQGAANTRVIRFGYDADYPDGIGDVIASSSKPNARDVSNAVNAQSSSILNDRGLSDWAVHWGQFLTHDITLIETGAQYNTLSTGAIGRLPHSYQQSQRSFGSKSDFVRSIRIRSDVWQWRHYFHATRHDPHPAMADQFEHIVH